MDFEWDPDKEDQNLKKHGVSFFEASEVFGDPLSLTTEDPDHSEDENRLLIFGQTISHKHLVVSFVEINSRIRLISARDMTKHEREAYEQ